jgi:hypothetical protein
MTTNQLIETSNRRQKPSKYRAILPSLLVCIGWPASALVQRYIDFLVVRMRLSVSA